MGENTHLKLGDGLLPLRLYLRSVIAVATTPLRRMPGDRGRCTEHKPSSPGGAILMFEPTGTLSTGDQHEGDIPAHVDSTAGRLIGDPG